MSKESTSTPGKAWRTVTVDLDDCTELDVMKAWKELERSGVVDMKGRISSGGNGVHLRGYANVSEQRMYEIRACARGDSKRIYWDSQHVYRPAQVMFTEKFGREASEWVYGLAHLLHEINEVGRLNAPTL